jgi:hypothetical protein
LLVNKKDKIIFKAVYNWAREVKRMILKVKEDGFYSLERKNNFTRGGGRKKMDLFLHFTPTVAVLCSLDENPRPGTFRDYCDTTTSTWL